MSREILRKIVRIDEEKCDGCGACIPACAEGALQIIDGKAKLISEVHCDGLGACLDECPQRAITIEERVAEEFDEEAVKRHLAVPAETTGELPRGCPGTAVTQLRRQEAASIPPQATPQASMLVHWPVQLTLVPPTAPFLRGADILLAADCVPFAYAGFHQGFLRDHALLVACPKLDNFQAHLMKLTNVLRHSQPQSLTVVRMEVPCCGGLVYMAKQAIRLSGRDISLEEVVVGIGGDLKSRPLGQESRREPAASPR